MGQQSRLGEVRERLHFAGWVRRVVERKEGLVGTAEEVGEGIVDLEELHPLAEHNHRVLGRWR
jgi:hypothetical protein